MTNKSKNKDKSSEVLVFSVAMNGYQYLYRDLLKSHRDYADRMGFSYVAIEKPGITTLGLECAWLKIALIIRALKGDYKWILFLDADTRVAKNAPDIRTLSVPGKDIYMAEGFSGRVNSGVMLIRNSDSTKHFFETVLNNAEKPLPAEDDVGWGENGHIIHYAKKSYIVQTIDRAWNNNHEASLNDFIRHYSAGPLRKLFKVNPALRLKYFAHRYTVALLRRWDKFRDPSPSEFFDGLNNLINHVCEAYPAFK